MAPGRPGGSRRPASPRSARLGRAARPGGAAVAGPADGLLRRWADRERGWPLRGWLVPGATGASLAMPPSRWSWCVLTDGLQGRWSPRGWRSAGMRPRFGVPRPGASCPVGGRHCERAVGGRSGGSGLLDWPGQRHFLRGGSRGQWRLGFGAACVVGGPVCRPVRLVARLRQRLPFEGSRRSRGSVLSWLARGSGQLNCEATGGGVVGHAGFVPAAWGGTRLRAFVEWRLDAASCPVPIDLPNLLFFSIFLDGCF